MPASTVRPASASTPAVHALDRDLLELQLRVRVDAVAEADERLLVRGDGLRAPRPSGQCRWGAYG